ncbi:hypothetical protein [Pontibacter cellulosilyticus]|uniref:STAS/SEC14 domain-containing protein n=1 Tax=Pontibacter cellulosilyticus TaxID=1720253 RepID=A0A923SHZ1_9BACT|nr:hypothetical protein [Pontibacter cellulosilyticus]MBC5992259.1 hypothetical protein [Pontibacter cellulosilyticus]
MPSDTIINDCSNILSIWGDSINWLSRIWVPKMTAMGLKQILHVSKANSFGFKIGEEMEKALNKQVNFSYFITREEAVQFLGENRPLTPSVTDPANEAKR